MGVNEDDDEDEKFTWSPFVEWPASASRKPRVAVAVVYKWCLRNISASEMCRSHHSRRRRAAAGCSIIIIAHRRKSSKRLATTPTPGTLRRNAALWLRRVISAPRAVGRSAKYGQGACDRWALALPLAGRG